MKLPYKLIYLPSLLFISCAATKVQSGGIYQPEISNNKTLTSNKTNNINHSIDSSQLTSNGSFSGLASWYGPGFHGKKTASGEVFDENKATAAHRTLPLGTQVRITNLDNGKSTLAEINDRGPFVGDRVLDGSKKVAQDLDYLDKGVANVKVDVIELGDVAGTKKYTQPIKVVSGNVVSSVVTVANAVAAPKSTIAAIVQLGAFKMPENAEYFKKSLASQFGDLVFKSFKRDDDLFVVMAGPYANIDKAEADKNKLEKGGYKGFVKTTAIDG